MPEAYVVHGERYFPIPDAEGFVEVGKASWYGSDFHGRPTSCGEPYNMYGMTAAHKILPLGTYVKVQNLDNSKSTIVRINDRGPFIKERVIDLSYAAAKEVDMIRAGVTEVRVVALGREIEKIRSGGDKRPLLEVQDFEKGEFTVQVGAFENKDNALRLVNRLKVIFDYVTVQTHIDEKKRTLYRVQASKSKTLSQAGAMEKRLEEMGFEEAFIVRL
ncbi:MAG: septal ring lytic transglycosylase RlpA family protein [Pseudomonadota bacterium]